MTHTLGPETFGWIGVPSYIPIGDVLVFPAKHVIVSVVLEEVFVEKWRRRLKGESEKGRSEKESE